MDTLDDYIIEATCRMGDLQIMKNLITHENANKSLRHDIVETVLDRCCLAGYIDCVQWLWTERGARSNNAICYAASAGQLKVVDFLLQQGASPNQVSTNAALNMRGQSALLLSRNCPCVTQALVNARADVHYAHGRINSPLVEMLVGRDGETGSAMILMQSGARIIPPSLVGKHHWARTYENQLDTKYRNCVRATTTCAMVCIRHKVPKDVYKLICKTLVLCTWLDDMWLIDDTSNKVQKI